MWFLGIEMKREHRIAGNFHGAKLFVVFVIEHWTTNILPTNEATVPTFTCSASRGLAQLCSKCCLLGYSPLLMFLPITLLILTY